MTSKSQKAVNACIELYNPLRGLTKPGIEMMLNSARLGSDTRLQVVFHDIEICSPIYQVCIEKRLAGITNRRWDILPNDGTPQAKAQAEFAKQMFKDCESSQDDDLISGIQHLVLANFRGRSALKPFIVDGKLVLKKLENWNLLQWSGKFWWNPTAQPVMFNNETGRPSRDDVVEVPKSEICYLVHPRPIDVPGLMLYLRQIVGEDQWARFVEKEGIPQIVLTPPSGTPDTELSKWDMRAMKIFEGGSGVLPEGSTVDQLTAARGQDPFSEYIKHQMEMISILATGGTLMTIGGSTGLGSTLAEVQKESFNSLVVNDCCKVSKALHNAIAKIAKLRGEEVLCSFQYVEEDAYTAKDYIEMAKQMSDMGMKIDQAKFQKLVNLDIFEDGAAEWSPDYSVPKSEE